MENKTPLKPLSIIFPRPWLNGDVDMTEGFDYGLLATSLTCSERVVVELTSLRELPTLIEKASEEEFRSYLKERRIEFLIHPDHSAIIAAPYPHLAMMTFPANARDLYKDGPSRLAALADAIQRNPLVDVEISSETADLIASQIQVTPQGLQERLMSDMARDLLDIRYRRALGCVRFVGVNSSMRNLVAVGLVEKRRSMDVSVVESSRFPARNETTSTEERPCSLPVSLSKESPIVNYAIAYG